MAQVVTLTDSVTVKPSETLTVAGVTATVNPTLPANTYSFTTGTSTIGTVASVIDLWWAKSGEVIASSGTKVWTLSALTDDLGRAVAFVRIRVILLQITTKTGNDYFSIGANGTNPWAAPFGDAASDLIKIRDLWHVVDNSPAGLVVASGSADRLLITNSGSASMTYTILLGGCST